MENFPIKWNIQKETFCRDGMQSELKLNDNWTVACTKRDDLSISLKFFRLITSEEKLISGTLSYGADGKDMQTKDFSELMEYGSSSITIDLSSFRHPMSYSELPDNWSYSFQGVVSISPGRKICTEHKSLVHLSTDFERLLHSQTSINPDVNFRCGDVLIPAHKFILSIRSPVFAAMFKNEMKENLQNQVDITDMDATTVRAMLMHIYTGKNYELTVSSASDLLFAADKYQLDDLKRACRDFLKKNCSIENMLRVLVLGDMHDKDLRSFAVNYICDNCDNFSVLESTEEWKSLRTQRAELAMDILISMVKRDRNPIPPHAVFSFGNR